MGRQGEPVSRLYAGGFVDDSPGGGKGRELIKEAVTGFHKAAHDLKFEIEDVFATEDKVVIRYTGKRNTGRGLTAQFRRTAKPLNFEALRFSLSKTARSKQSGRNTTGWGCFGR
jgi:hypothetical protein